MDTLLDNKSGFTIVEVLVSAGIMILLLPFAAGMLTTTQLLASYSKHKIQAAYAAQQIIENQRQSAFVVVPAGTTVTILPSPSSVILDTKGNYASANCNNNSIFCGTAVVKATQAVYTGTNGVAQAASTTVDHYVVTIQWIEQIVNLKVPMTETYAEDIVNDTMLN
jgi:type II secretory pathway pseudopilin PulG